MALAQLPRCFASGSRGKRQQLGVFYMSKADDLVIVGGLYPCKPHNVFHLVRDRSVSDRSQRHVLGNSHSIVDFRRIHATIPDFPPRYITYRIVTRSQKLRGRRSQSLERTNIPCHRLRLTFCPSLLACPFSLEL